jgi:uncharacterized protein (TIGR03382 family)
MRTKLMSIVAGSSLALAGVAMGTPLNAGTTIAATPFTAPAGIVLATQTTPYAGTMIFGTLTSSVINDPSNPLGGLTFVYIINTSNISVDAVERLTVTGFTGWNVDASWGLLSVGTSIPDRFTRSLTGSGNVVGASWDLPNGIYPGDSSVTIVFRTNAPSWTNSTANVINGSIAATPTYAPAIPAPGAAALLGLSGALVARRRR